MQLVSSIRPNEVGPIDHLTQFSHKSCTGPHNMQNIQRSFSNRRLLLSRSASKAACVGDHSEGDRVGSFSLTDLTMSDDCDPVVEISLAKPSKPNSRKGRIAQLKTWLRSASKKQSSGFGGEAEGSILSEDDECLASGLPSDIPFPKREKAPEIENRASMESEKKRSQRKKRPVRITKNTDKDVITPKPSKPIGSAIPLSQLLGDVSSVDEDSCSSSSMMALDYIHTLSPSSRSAFHSTSLPTPKKDNDIYVHEDIKVDVSAYFPERSTRKIPPCTLGVKRSVSIDDSVLSCATEETKTMVEVAPKCFMPLVSAKETKQAVRRGHVCLHMCLSCGEPQYTVSSVELVVCTFCRTIEPLPVGQAGGGVGMGFQESTVFQIFEAAS